MARIESSAVNNLIDLAGVRPLDRDSQDDLLFAPPHGGRPANASNRARRTPAATAAGSPPCGADPRTAAAIGAPEKAVALVGVRVESTPSGATVTLLDAGKSSFIGTTPVDASVDPSRSYDVVLSREGEPPH